MAAANKPKTTKVKGVRVASKQEGFRRAGRAWSAEATDVAVSDLTKEQLAQLKSDPMLVVVDIEMDVEGESGNSEGSE